MPNLSLDVECTVAGEERADKVVLKKDGSWSSSHDGWFKSKSGKWVQNSLAGVALSSIAGKKVGFMKGLIFDTAGLGDVGSFNYDEGGDAGRWKVI